MPWVRRFVRAMTSTLHGYKSYRLFGIVVSIFLIDFYKLDLE